MRVTVAASVSGADAAVLFAGLQGSYDGLDQVNLSVPKSVAGSGTVDVVVTADGKATNAVQVLFQ